MAMLEKSRVGRTSENSSLMIEEVTDRSSAATSYHGFVQKESASINGVRDNRSLRRVTMHNNSVAEPCVAAISVRGIPRVSVPIRQGGGGPQTRAPLEGDFETGKRSCIVCSCSKQKRSVVCCRRRCQSPFFLFGCLVTPVPPPLAGPIP